MTRASLLKLKEWHKSALRSLVAGSAVAGIVALTSLAISPTAVQAESVVNGVVLTASAQTVTARSQDLDIATAPMPDLAVTVPQTRDLVSQGLVISWTGGKPSARGGADGATNYLQIAQCWGEDPQHPGHADRTTCQYGTPNSTGATRDNFMAPEKVAAQDLSYSIPDGSDRYVSIPFKSVSGEEISSIEDGKISKTTNANINKFFTPLTTNVVNYAGSSSGSGSQKFEIQTNMQSPALGCGNPVLSGSNASGQPCWLVIIPHGDSVSSRNDYNQSGLLWNNFKHAISLKLDFKPLGVRCEIGSVERQVSGSELVSGALASWQPQLCLGTNGSAYVLSTGNEQDTLATAATDPKAPLAITSQPLIGQTDNLVYAPVGISGISISFAIDYTLPRLQGLPKSLVERNQKPIESINITPRILAKLLTASYFDALPSGDRTHIGYKSYLDTGPNAQNLSTDKDFLSVNDMSLKYMRIISVSLSDVITPIGRSDLAERIWEYVLSDQDAVDFLNGVPDPWGMKVNPYYSTSASVNPLGTPLALPRRDFPKADPIERPDTLSLDPDTGTGALNLITWRPYSSDFENGAYLTLRGDGLILGNWNPSALPPKYNKGSRADVGGQSQLAVTTTAAAAKYQNISASLLNPAGNFVSPTRESMAAAQAAMIPTTINKAVRSFDFSSSAALSATTAYPLTMPIYAAANPTLLDSSLRKPYSQLIKFAAANGQAPGTELGQLPLGYAPLSEGWVQQALQAASLIELGASSVVIPETIPTPLPTPDVTPSPTVPETQPVVSIVGVATQKDPTVGPAKNAIPTGFIGGALAALLYPNFARLRRATKK